MGGRSASCLGLAVLWAAILGPGCAKGGADLDGGGTGRRDGGTTIRRDSSVPPGRDGGGPGTPCTDEGHAALCEMATDLGMLMPGDVRMPAAGVLPARDDADWFRVQFPSLGMPGMAGGGTPRIELVRNDDMQFRFEVRASCSATFACGGTMMGARDILEWTFTDDQAMEGEMAYSTRDVPWPAQVFVRVYRPTAPASCGSYELRVTR